MADYTTEAAIIGGGAAGCAAAYYLAQAGIGAIVVERERIAAFASGYSAGGLNPLEGAGIPGPLGEMAIASFRMHQNIWQDLIERSGVDFEPSVISSVRVAFDDADMAELRATQEIFDAADADFSAEWLDAARLRRLEPRISADAIGALDARGNAILSSERFTRALAGAAETLGARTLTAEALGIESEGGNIRAISTTAGKIACDAAVFATGPWSARVGEWLGASVPVEPYKGEIVRTTLASGALSADFESADVSLNRREAGQIWVGSTEERVGFDLEPSAKVRKGLLSAAVRLMPDMANAKVALHTACLRPLSPDWLPIVGRAPGWENAYLATGAGKKGILLSPAIGKATADLVADGETSLPISGFAPDRFG